MVDDAAAGVAGSADDAGTAVASVADEATAGVAGFADEAGGGVAGVIDDAGTTGNGTTGFRGSRGFQLSNVTYQPVRNSPGSVMGRHYSAHAFDQMQNRGIVPSVVENAIRTGTFYPRNGANVYFDAVNRIRVVVNAQNGTVITVIPGSP